MKSRIPSYYVIYLNNIILLLIIIYINKAAIIMYVVYICIQASKQSIKKSTEGGCMTYMSAAWKGTH